MTNTVFFPGLGLEFELNRVAFTVFGHNIYWYGVIIAAGFLLAVIYGLHIAPRFGMDPDKITDAIFVVVPMAILGARTNNESMLNTNLRQAVRLDSSMAQKAVNDLEFANYNLSKALN